MDMLRCEMYSTLHLERFLAEPPVEVLSQRVEERKTFVELRHMQVQTRIHDLHFVLFSPNPHSIHLTARDFYPPLDHYGFHAVCLLFDLHRPLDTVKRQAV